jgi:hypothetical protein
VWAGTKGITGDRTFVIRWEGVEGPWLLNDDPTPTTIWEMTFYENPTNRIDLHVVSNAAYRGEFTSAQLEDYGILQNGGVAPQRDAALDADIADCIADGIIFVGSAGNSGFKIDTESLSSTADYNNYFVDYDNGDILEPTYYHRGSSPSVSETSICVGNLGSLTNEGRNARSNAGPRVDLYAPGTNIASAVYDNTGTSGTDWSSQPVNESGQLYQKYTGSSMSAAQVTGYLALVLENHPDMTHDEAKQYLLQNARDGQMYDSNSSAFSDTSSLLGGNNKILYARQDRETDGAVYPTSLEWLRPATGNVFPRPKIKRS